MNYCFWFTGLSGAGKTTLATQLIKRASLWTGRSTPVLVDGDAFRDTVNIKGGFSFEDRLHNVTLAARVAKLILDQGADVLACFVSPMRVMREQAKDLIGSERFVEIYVTTPVSVCAERDTKGLYAANTANLTGVSQSYEEPLEPDLWVDLNPLDFQLSYIESHIQSLFSSKRAVTP